MLNSIFRFIKGSVDFEGSGKFPERFLNLTARRGINLWNTRPSDGGLKGSMSLSDYRKIRPAARKAGVRLRVTKKRGLPFAAAKYKARRGLLAGAAAAAALVYFLSGFVWTVEINGTENVSQSKILGVLAENGLRPGILRSSLDVSRIKRETLLDIEELGWLSVNLSGGRATVEVREKAEKPPVNTRQKPRNIMARCDGVITGCKVRNGALEITKGSGVVKGQMLVSGVLPTERNTVRYVCADADIYADVNSVKEITIPKTVSYNSITENKAVTKRFFLFNFSLPCSFAYQGFTNAVYTAESENFMLNGTVLPAGFSTRTASGISAENRAVTKAQAQKSAEAALALYEVFEKGGSKIKSRTIKISEDKNAYTVKASYIFNENIAKTVDFTVEEE